VPQARSETYGPQPRHGASPESACASRARSADVEAGAEAGVPGCVEGEVGADVGLAGGVCVVMRESPCPAAERYVAGPPRPGRHVSAVRADSTP